MIRTLLALFRPLTTIAKEITTLRELYELDLQSRVPPIYRVTEKPKKDDTEVTYMGVKSDTRFEFEYDEEDD